MRHQLFFTTILILVFGICSSQNLKPIAQLVENAKIENKSFKIVQEVIQINNKKVALSGIIDPSKVVLFDYNTEYFLTEISNKNVKYVSFEVPLEEKKTVIIDLVEVQETFYDYEMKTSSGKTKQTNTNAKHFRGVVRGIENESLVSLSFFEEELVGIISINDLGNYNIGRLKNKVAHIIFNDNNIRQPPFVCEVDEADAEIIEYNEQELSAEENKRASQTCLKIYFEVDYGIYKHLDSNLINVENYVVALFNEVSTIYQNEGMFVEISEIFIWESEDPFENDGPGSALYPFRNFRTSFNGDLAHLLSYRDNEGTLPARGIAYLNGMCSNSPRYYAVSELYPTFENYPNYSHQVQVVTHEIAHNIGSQHTHQCVWNGNGTQIDDYGSVSQNDIPSDEQDCFNQPGIFDVTPTIMSYYGSRGWGTYPLTNGFGEQPGNLLRNKIASANCLTDCVNCFPELVKVYADNEDITYTLNVNLPCGETCFLLDVTNLDDVEYRMTGNVTIGADGSVCIPQNTFESSGGLIEITGIDSCGNVVTKGITITVEDCCPITPPSNLQVIGNTLHWDPVPNAIGYEVSSPHSIEIDCDCTAQISVLPIYTTTNSLELTGSLKGYCFVWQVIALCHDDVTSPVSDQACYSPTIGFTSLSLEDAISILPNPNNGIMNIRVDLDYNTDIQLHIYRTNGTLVKTMKNLVIKNGVNIYWDSHDSLQKGLYLFVFNTDRDTITKKVLVE